MPLDGLAHPQLSSAASQEQRPSKRKSKHKTQAPPSPPPEPDQAPHPSHAAGPRAQTAEAPALFDPLDEPPPGGDTPDAHGVKRKAKHAGLGPDLDPAPGSPVAATSGPARLLSDAAEPSLLEDSVEDLMPVGVMPAPAAAKPAKVRHSKHSKAGKEKSSKSSKSSTSKLGIKGAEGNRDNQPSKDELASAHAPVQPEAKLEKAAYADREGAERSSHLPSSRHRLGREHATALADAPGATSTDQRPARAAASGQLRSRSPSRLEPAGPDRHAEQHIMHGRQAEAAQRPSRRPYSSWHRSKSLQHVYDADASVAGEDVAASLAEPLQPAAHASDAHPSSGAGVGAAPAQAGGCSKPALGSTSQAQPGLYLLSQGPCCMAFLDIVMWACRRAACMTARGRAPSTTTVQTKNSTSCHLLAVQTMQTALSLSGDPCINADS